MTERRYVALAIAMFIAAMTLVQLNFLRLQRGIEESSAEMRRAVAADSEPNAGRPGGGNSLGVLLKAQRQMDDLVAALEELNTDMSAIRNNTAGAKQLPEVADRLKAMNRETKDLVALFEKIQADISRIPVMTQDIEETVALLRETEAAMEDMSSSVDKDMVPLLEEMARSMRRMERHLDNLDVTS